MTCRYGVYRVNFATSYSSSLGRRNQQFARGDFMGSKSLVNSWPVDPANSPTFAMSNCLRSESGWRFFSTVAWFWMALLQSIKSETLCQSVVVWEDAHPFRTKHYNECLSILIPKASLKSLIEVTPEIRECMVLKDQFHWGMRFEKATWQLQIQGVRTFLEHEM